MDKKINDYLTKQLYIENNVVTFRSLSRQFKIHVNQAKNELQTFYTTSQDTTAHATFLVSGELPTRHVSNGESQESDMDVDGEEHDAEDDSEIVPEVRVSLVGQDDLESVKSSYAKIYSVHVYCLSPSPVIDAGLICTPAPKIHEVDNKLTPEQGAQLGRITGPHVQKGKAVRPTALAAAKPKEPTVRKAPPPDTKPSKDAKPKEEPSAAGGPTEKPTKQSGKLDWTKAKVKGQVKKEPEEDVKIKDAKAAKAKEEKEVKAKEEKEVKAKEEKEAKRKLAETKKLAEAKKLEEAKEKEREKKAREEEKAAKAVASKPGPSKSLVKEPAKPEAKRGLKRKSALPVDSDSEDDKPSTKPSSSTSKSDSAPPSKARSRVKVKGTVIVSDDDDDDDAPPRPPPKSRRLKKARSSVLDIDMDDDIPTKAEMSVRAMMDIDDDEVIRASTTRDRDTERETEPPETEPEFDGATATDVDMADVLDIDEDEDDDIPVVPKQPRKKRVKKVVPIGSNGLKKRRVVKTRMETDERGYMVSVDYSEYESVDEEEAEEEPSPEPTKKAPAKVKKESEAEEPVARKTLRPGTGGTKRSAGSQKRGQGSLMYFFGKNS